MPGLRLEVLPAQQVTVFKQLQAEASRLDQLGLYLAGGTALALQIGHRQSVDFDFFSQQPDIGEKVFVWLEPLPEFTLRDKDANTIHGEIGGVKVSFIGAYKYPLVEKLVASDSISLAGIRDIALMKLLAITNRATVRDYIDLAAIIRNHIPLENLLEDSQKKYGGNFNTMVLVRALVSFDDLDPEYPHLLDKTLATSWQGILREAVKKAVG